MKKLLKTFPPLRLLLLAEVLLHMHRHWRLLSLNERQELRKYIRHPRNLSKRDRKRIIFLIRKMKPTQLALEFLPGKKKK